MVLKILICEDLMVKHLKKEQYIEYVNNLILKIWADI